MKITVEKLILAFVFLISSTSSANAEYVSKGKIVEIRVGEKGSIGIVRESNANQENCSDARKFFISGTYENSMPMLTAILAAYQSNREVTFQTNSCGGEGYTNRIFGVVLE